MNKLARIQVIIGRQLRREERQIARLERERDRPQGRGYMYYLVFLICVIYIADEVATQIGTQMQNVVAQALFAPVFGAEVAVARMGLLGMVSMLGFPLSLIYRPLSDRYGRKLFLVLNTLGMGVGLLIISVSANIPVYLLGAFAVSFFTPHDVQQVYIFESMPAKRRATYFAVIKAIATMGMMLIPVLRNLLMGDDITQWRYVYMVPGAIAAAVAVFALLAVRETPPFVKKRLEYLNMSQEEREAIKTQKGAEGSQGGVVAALKYVFRHKQLRFLILAGGFLMWGAVLTMYYETSMTFGYASFVDAGASAERARQIALPYVTQALFLFPVGSALFQLIQGFLADKLGRKPTVIVMCVCSISAYLLFFFGARNGWDAYLIGFLCGGAVGSYWAAFDVAGGIMCSESTPTNLRASVLAVQPIIAMVFSLIAFLAAMLSLNLLGDAYAGIISVCIAVPGMVIGILIILFKVRETKGTNLEEITGFEDAQ